MNWLKGNEVKKLLPGSFSEKCNIEDIFHILKHFTIVSYRANVTILSSIFCSFDAYFFTKLTSKN